MSTPQAERPDDSKDTPEEQPRLDRIQRPMEDLQTEPALDHDADPPEDV